MKNLLLIVLTILATVSCSSEETPFIENEQSAHLETILKAEVLDIDDTSITTDYLKGKWEKQLADEGTPYKLGDFQVVTTTVADNTKTFFLKAKSIYGTFENHI